MTHLLAIAWSAVASNAVLTVAVSVAIAVGAGCVYSRMWAQFAAWIVYVALVAIVASSISDRASKNPYLNGEKKNVSYLARRKLPKNTRLAENDWRKPPELPAGYF